MVQDLIYLAGPIAGLSYESARNGWRKQFAALMPLHILCLSPMRGKEFLQGETVIRGSSDMYPENEMSSPHGIVCRDFSDVSRCSVLVANFIGATKVSIGTCVEFGWANALRKPVVLIIEKEGNPHDHAFLTQIAGYRVDTVEAAAHLVIHLLTPGV